MSPNHMFENGTVVEWSGVGSMGLCVHAGGDCRAPFEEAEKWIVSLSEDGPARTGEPAEY